jgi:hypothetical protein
LYHYTLLILTGLTLMLGIRQFWNLIGIYTDFKIFILVFIFSFFFIQKLK